MAAKIVEPCPFCGTVPTEYTVYEGEVLDTCTICCPQCGYSSGTKNVYPTDALIDWNCCAQAAKKIEQLKNCPFCGSRELEIKYDHGFYVRCPECKVKAGPYSLLQDVIDTWNKRTVIKPLALPKGIDTNQDENLCEGEEK